MNKLDFFFLFILFTIVRNTDNKLSNEEKSSGDSNLKAYMVCRSHCQKMSLIYNCGCDLNCKEYNDCCDMSLLDTCIWFHDQKETNESIISESNNEGNEEFKKLESCCGDKPPENCRCDSICKTYQDCCSDYEICLKMKVPEQIKKPSKSDLPPELQPLVKETTKIEKMNNIN